MKNNLYSRSIETLIIFYLIGIVGFAIPLTRQFFTGLIPLALIFSAVLLAVFHQPRLKVKTVAVFAIIYIISYLIEVAGVKTGILFGNYTYLNGLGPKLMDTPLLIGLNWLMLVYCSKVITERLSKNKVIRILLPPLLMVGYDLILEQVAPIIGMWEWTDGRVPVKNYITWFIIAMIFHILIRQQKISFSNKMATPVFFVQFLFFIILTIYFSFSMII